MLLDRLPGMDGSQFIAAQRADPDVAEAILDRQERDQAAGKSTPPWRPRDAEWRQEHELLTKNFDRLGEILAVLASHPLPKKAKPKKPPRPHPRPVHGFDVAKARRRNRYIAELEADVVEAQARWAAQHPEATTTS